MERYEKIRRCVTDGSPAGTDGVFILRHQGLRGWIDHINTAPHRPRSEALVIGAREPIATPFDSSSLVCLCTDLLLTKLNAQGVR